MPDKKDSLLDNFLALTKVASPSRREREVAKILARRIREMGYEPLEDDTGQAIGGDCGNIVVKVPANGGGPNLLLSAHLDTVEKVGEPSAVPEVEGSIVRRQGGGILGADDKAGVAALLELLSKLKSGKKKHGELLFVFTVAEEVGSLGAQELDPQLYRHLEGGIVLDYSRPNEIVVAAPTRVIFKIVFHGIAGHASAPDRKINAAHVMAKTLAVMPSGRLDEHTTANIGIARAGSAVNVIPEKAYVEYEIRSHRKDVLDFHVKRILGIIEGVVRENRIFAFADADKLALGDGKTQIDAVLSSSVDVEVEVSFEGFRIPEDDKLVVMAKKAVEKANLEPVLITTLGGSDANILNKRNLPCLVMGCGMHGAHSQSEYANIKEMKDIVEILVNLVKGS